MCHDNLSYALNMITSRKMNYLGPTGPRWAPCWPHEPCYLGHVCISWDALHVSFLWNQCWNWSFYGLMWSDDAVPSAFDCISADVSSPDPICSEQWRYWFIFPETKMTWKLQITKLTIVLSITILESWQSDHGILFPHSTSNWIITITITWTYAKTKILFTPQ